MSLEERVNPELKQYIESTLFPQYESLNGEAHGIGHIKQVIQRTYEIGDEYEESNPDQEPLNANIAYITAAYHDIGDHVNRKKHHIISAEMMMADKGLDAFVTPEEKLIIKEAIEDHRASKEEIPRTIYGRLVLTADRNNELQDFFERRIKTSMERHPEFTEEQILDEVYKSSYKKFGRNSGYALKKPGYLPSKKLEAHFERITELLDDEEKFKEEAKKYLKKYVSSLRETQSSPTGLLSRLFQRIVFGRNKQPID